MRCAGCGGALKCGALSSTGINTTTKVVIGTCASWATEPELCDVYVVSVDRIVSLGFNLFFLPEAGCGFERLVCLFCSLKSLSVQYYS